MNKIEKLPIKAIIGLGNPGKQFENTRHNAGFLVLDALADKYGANWQVRDNKEVAEVVIGGKKVILIKPQTFMNSSGKVVPSLLKQGIKAENILVVHDELEKAPGVVDVKVAGSHRGHNGLRSIIEQCGANFVRVRIGIGRPVHKEDVGEYVLSNFSYDVSEFVDSAIDVIETLLD